MLRISRAVFDINMVRNALVNFADAVTQCNMFFDISFISTNLIRY